jgi:hypothetical protein
MSTEEETTNPFDDAEAEAEAEPVVQARPKISLYKSANKWLQRHLTILKKRMSEPLFITIIAVTAFIAHTICSRYQIDLHKISIKLFQTWFFIYMSTTLFSLVPLVSPIRRYT